MDKRIFLILIAILSACKHQPKNNRPIAVVKPAAKPESRSAAQVINDSIYIKNNCTFIRSDGKLIRIPVTIDTTNEVSSNSIYQTDGSTIKKCNMLCFDKYIYFAIWNNYTEGLGTGHYDLKVFDTVSRKLFGTNGDGKFIVDKKDGKVFNLGSGLYKGGVIAIASVYNIDGDHLNFIKNVYQNDISLDKGPGDDDDSLVLKFYNGSLANGARNAKTLPKDWWKHSD
jgi:hypothetical protein